MKKSNYKFRSTFIQTVLWLTITVVGHSQGLNQGALDSLYAHYQNSISNKTLAGVESLLIVNDRVVWHQAQGYQDVSAEKALKPNSIFYIQSMTKPIMSVAIMQLVERGFINLNDPIEIYIPEAKYLRVAVDPNLGLDSPTQKINRSITIRDLLTHTSGLSHGLGDTKLDQQLFEALYVTTPTYAMSCIIAVKSPKASTHRHPSRKP